MKIATWTLADTLREYDAGRQDDEIDRFRNMRGGLATVIRAAAESRDEDGLPYPHQAKNWSFWPDSIPQAMAILPKAEARFQACEDFNAILELVTELVADIPGLRTLYCYDVAFRIGAFLGHFPERVFLHAGTREGAKRLGLPWRRGYLQVSELPEALRQRQPWEVENILCHHAKRCRRQDRQAK
jgi:hypothetical protein